MVQVFRILKDESGGKTEEVKIKKVCKSEFWDIRGGQQNKEECGVKQLEKSGQIWGRSPDYIMCFINCLGVRKGQRNLCKKISIFKLSLM